MSSLGQPIPHESATGHVTGTAPYIDDLVPRTDELLVGFAGSPVASGTITRINLAAAKETPGVVAVLTASDIPGKKIIGPLFQDEPVLAEREVLYVGQPVVIIAAKTRVALEAGIEAVSIDVAERTPVLSIDQALAAKRFIGPERQIRRGDTASALAASPHHLQGVFHSKGQDQFYLESQAAIAYPAEEGQLVLHSSTQSTTEVQRRVAEALGLGMHEVVCICKRMGGAFGGKESQATLPAIFVALVAHHTGRSARIVYNKDIDMQSTGKRHAYRTEWEVGFDEKGQILAYRAQFHSDGGAAADLSTSIMQRTLLHAENSYFIPNIDVCGQVCFTNNPPNTAFRGFGGPQAMAVIENVMQEIATHRRLDGLDVRRRNLYGGEGRETTPYGQKLGTNHLPEIVSQLAESCDYRKRYAQLESTNAADRLRLHGLALVPVKFGISFTTKFLNQANALVNLYTDGTVQVSTGGTEMGQGLHTKIRQLVADAFGLATDQVRVMPTSTEKNNNTSPTAASAGTDLNGAAALDACAKIKQRLAGFAAGQFASSRVASTDSGLQQSSELIVFDDGAVYDSRRPDERIAFGQLCDAARRERIDLGARGFHKTPGIDFDRETGRGTPFEYFTQGAAVAEVNIDRFTGELIVPRVDLLIDIGRSLNPGIDMGQITGGFVQGMGWVTAESLEYNDHGLLQSHSPTTYKIPSVTDVPGHFHCQMFANDDDSNNLGVENVGRAKAVGEPPLMHALCVWAAVKQALDSLTPGASSDLRLPATGEEILRCITKATKGSPR